MLVSLHWFPVTCPTLKAPLLLSKNNLLSSAVPETLANDELPNKKSSVAVSPEALLVKLALVVNTLVVGAFTQE